MPEFISFCIVKQVSGSQDFLLPRAQSLLLTFGALVRPGVNF